MSRVRQYGFGPGRLESLRLRLWKQPSRHQDLNAVQVELEGFYTVYCGAGWEHNVEIAERHSVDLDHPVHDIDREVIGLWQRQGGDPELASSHIADQLTEWALENWEDPCSDDEP